MSKADSKIVFTEEWRLVDDARSVTVCDVFVGHNPERSGGLGAILGLLLQMLEVLKEGLIGLAHQLTSHTLTQDLSISMKLTF